MRGAIKSVTIICKRLIHPIFTCCDCNSNQRGLKLSNSGASSIMSKRKREWQPTDSSSMPDRPQSSFSIPELLHHNSDMTTTRSLSAQNLHDSPMMPVRQNSMQVNDTGQSSTRKFTACEGCRKQKIKCDMPDDEPPCTRCKRRSLPCVLNKNVQALFEDTKKTDQTLRIDVANLHQTLAQVCQQLKIDALKPLQSEAIFSQRNGNGSASQSGDDPDCEVSPPLSPSAVQAPIDTFMEVVKMFSPGSGQSPASKRASSRHDLVSKGLITTQVAERLLDRYFNRLDHYLYGIASKYKGPDAARQASPILFAAICTVSALHDTGSDPTVYEVCNQEFRRLVARALFDKGDVEHIRALCIASFWLSDASRILSSDAIRRAGDIRFHRAFKRAIHPVEASPAGGVPNAAHPSLTTQQATDHVRLWYLLFVCDQHMSILHNRDSLLRSDREITTDWESFLEREDREDNDVRIMSQTSLLLIMGQVRDTLGAKAEERLPTSMHSQLMMFSRQLDKWFNKFSDIFKPNPHIGGFPAKGLRLHYHFGKLNLGHYVFQGLRGAPVPDVFIGSAVMAHDAATAIFYSILEDEDLQQDLLGMPHYFHIMIAFAGHFLLEVCNKYHVQLSLNLHEDLGMLNRVLMLFNNVRCHQQHPLRRMSPGLSQKLFECAAQLNVQLGFSNDPSDLATQMTASNAAQNQQQHQQQSMQYSQPIMDTYQYAPTQMDPMNELGFANFSDFEFPTMSMNFMT